MLLKVLNNSPNRRVNRTARVSFFSTVEKLLKDVLSINFIGNPCCPLPKRYLKKYKHMKNQATCVRRDSLHWLMRVFQHTNLKKIGPSRKTLFYGMSRLKSVGKNHGNGKTRGLGRKYKMNLKLLKYGFVKMMLIFCLTKLTML